MKRAVKKEGPVDKYTKRVRVFLSLDPLRIVEGTVTIPSPKTRLSDMINDERTFLSLQDTLVPKEWGHCFSDFVLLNKKDIKALIEIG